MSWLWHRADRARRKHDPRAIIRGLTALTIIVALGTFSLGGYVLVESRHDTWTEAERDANNLSLALARDIERTIKVYDLSLQAVSDGLKQPGIFDTDPAIRNLALFDHAATAEYLGSMIVLNAQGDVVADSTSVVPHPGNYADREYFRYHRDHPDGGLYISRAFRSRILNQSPYIITLSRRLNGPGGTFNGVVSGALRLDYFDHLFHNLDLGPHGSVTLLRTDGRVVARRPFRQFDIDSDLSSAPIARHMARAPSGTFIDTAQLDRIRRFYVYRRIGNLPLVLNVGFATHDILAKWRPKAVLIAVLLVALCTAITALGITLRGELLRRLGAEERLREAVEKISYVAATDSLTGLANRRAFDAALSAEWRRAMRDDTPLGLLILDADNFKLFNDRYGHPRGDEVLRAIADCIQASIRRPGDIAARYGGEEFAAVLPATDLAGAMTIAERIRDAIAARHIEHAASPNGTVSASIGVAVRYPASGLTEADLLTAADEALYEAKLAGRARIHVSGGVTAELSRWDQFATH